MTRLTTVVVAVLLLVGIGALVTKGGRVDWLPAMAAADAGHDAAGDDAGIDAEALDLVAFPSAFEVDAAAAPRETASAEPGAGLPPGSPKTVRFGVILVQYRGAQMAPASARPKDEALALARSLAEAARTDFKAQVARGDTGSMEDAGRIPRGMLEPVTEYTLFTMSPGGVSDPIDTPRGFWIVKRLD